MSEWWMNEGGNEWKQLNYTGYQEKLLALWLIMDTRGGKAEYITNLLWWHSVILITVIYVKVYFFCLITMQ